MAVCKQNAERENAHAKAIISLSMLRACDECTERNALLPKGLPPPLLPSLSSVALANTRQPEVRHQSAIHTRASHVVPSTRLEGPR